MPRNNTPAAVKALSCAGRGKEPTLGKHSYQSADHQVSLPRVNQSHAANHSPKMLGIKHWLHQTCFAAGGGPSCLAHVHTSLPRNCRRKQAIWKSLSRLFETLRDAACLAAQLGKEEACHMIMHIAKGFSATAPT
jgi:hypothetical protein